ncbi:CHAT domain-containing protein [Desulfobacterales bacterium HSG17]|nr:CHAT domain-containing protein [Desulfobacterales bacterium HSG17]
MPNLFILDVETRPDENFACFRLSDGDGVHLAAHEVKLSGEDASMWEGLFDMRDHVDTYGFNLKQGETLVSAEELMARLGVFLGQKVLGAEIAGLLHEGINARTLIVRLPDTGKDGLAAAFARVPWEIARPEITDAPLLARNLAVRAVTQADMPEDREIALDLDRKQALRVLLIFAEAPGSAPLAMRLERERLLDLFYHDIMPNKNIEVDVLCHGVNREQIEAQVKQVKGYHIVHWSGHGYYDSLELTAKDGGRDVISGAELVDIFTRAGGFIPSVFFLSACHSGSLIKAEDWESLRALLLQPGTKEKEKTPELAKLLSQRKGYTGTALALLESGVPQVAAMRYAVGDIYARRLARKFYRHLLAENHPADTALALARTELANDTGRASEQAAADHATPLLFGRDRLAVSAGSGKSRQLKRIFQRYFQHPLLEGDLRKPEHFVGRGKELTRLIREWLPRKKPALALIQGLAGLGKTALAAEALHLWYERFDLVLAVQSREYEMTADAFYREIDTYLVQYSKEYRDTCREDDLCKIFIPKDEFKGKERFRIMRDNLINALHDERILLVIDNFEPNLFDSNACKDPEWEQLLTDLGSRLDNTGSRVLLTSRHRPNVLKDKAVVWLSLGPLPLNEANLFIQGHEALRRLWFNKDFKSLAIRTLEISRGHPLILQRLGTLAHEPETLSSVLDKLETKGYEQLPDLVIGPKNDAEREQERKYLEDVAVGAVDVLLERLNPDERQMLRVLTLAFEPVDAATLVGVWEEKFQSQAPGPLLAALSESGLVQKQGKGETAVYSFHELVRERCAAWMDLHTAEQGKHEAKEIWQAYGERYAGIFKHLMQSGQPGSREAGTEMGRRALTYIVRAEAFEKLIGFASDLVITTRNPQQLQAVIAELKSILEQVPEGKTRWSVRTYIADALDNSGQTGQSLAFYEQAVEEAESEQNWTDVGAICQNWANALGNAGRLSQARETYQRSAQAGRKAGSPEINIIAAELEALRIDIFQGQVKEALPKIEAILSKLRNWWQSHKKGQNIPHAPDAAFLSRVLISALDIASAAHQSLKNWQNCLDLDKETEETKQVLGESEHELARTKYNQYGALIRLGKLSEAQQVLEGCLQVFKKADDLTMQSKTLSGLANIWKERGDLPRAIELEQQALAVKERLDDPGTLAVSHGNLSNYLYASGKMEDSAFHRLAQMVYRIITNNKQGLTHCLRNLAIHIKQGAQTNTPYTLANLATLLTNPEFAALTRFLKKWEVDIDELQGKIDELVAGL